MSAPEALGAMSDADLANFSVNRSGASVTVRCWYLTCAQPIVVRRRTVNVLDLVRDVERHWRVHHRVVDDDQALREVGAAGEQLAMLRKAAAEHGISL